MVKGDAGATDIGGWLDSGGFFVPPWPSQWFSHQSINALADSVHITDYSVTWKYKCVDGRPNEWITMWHPSEDCRLFSVWADPLDDEDGFPKVVYEYSCDYCNGANGTDPDVVCVKALHGMAEEYEFGGNCRLLSSDYRFLVQAQGVGVELHEWEVVSPYETMSSRLLDFIGPPEDVLEVGDWGPHCWVEAGGKQRDPSIDESRTGSKQDYEDWIIEAYESDDNEEGAGDPAQGTWNTTPDLSESVFQGPHG